MTPSEALAIIQGISRTADRYPNSLARPLSALPCSLGKARYAILLYLEHLILHGSMTQQEGDGFKAIYTLLGTFVADRDIPRFNEIRNKYKSEAASEQERYIWRAFTARFIKNFPLEINCYINDLYGHRDNEDLWLDYVI
jgi:hypothetical protein